MSRRAISLMLFGGAVMAPLFALGHGVEFLVAKLEVQPALVRLEITVDYAGHPMLTDETAATAAIRTVLKVGDRALEDLAPLKLERRQQWDPQTPAAFAPMEGQQHQLLTGVWQWEPEDSEISFQVPKGSRNDVLLWTVKPDGEAKWLILIGGDQTPPIPVPAKAGKAWGWVGAGLAGLIAVVFLLCRGGLRLAGGEARRSAFAADKSAAAKR